MQNNPLISIITVCRNSVKTIAQTMQSVLDQTFSDIEYIVVDGGSTDGTLGLIKEYEKKFNGRMKWVTEKDNGIYDALNKGIGMSRGELIGAIHSDDWYEKDAVENAVSAHRKDPGVVIYGLMRIYDAELEKEVITYNARMLKAGIMIPHPTCFVLKAIYDKYGKFDLMYKYASDYDCFVRFYENGVKFVQIDRILANFRTMGTGTSQCWATRREAILIMFRHGIITNISMIRLVMDSYLDEYQSRIKKIIIDGIKSIDPWCGR